MAKKSKKSALRAKSKSKAPSPQQIHFNEEIEEKLAANVLKCILALYLLKNIRKPTSSLVQELFDIEIEVGRFIGKALRSNAKPSHNDLNGLLASALSFIPLQGGTSASKTSVPKRILK